MKPFSTAPSRSRAPAARRQRLAGWARLGCGAILGCALSLAAAEELQLQQRHALLGYTSVSEANAEAPYNRDNRYAALPGSATTAEWRGDFFLRGAAGCQVSLSLRGNASASHDPAPGLARQRRQDLYARSGGAVCAVGEALELRAGRFVLGWGNATFRSPSNALFSDTGKTDPVRELIGRDMLGLAWRFDTGLALSALLVDEANGRVPQPGSLARAWLLRLDHTGNSHSAGLVLSRPLSLPAGADDRPWRVGAYGTWTLSQASLLYAEAGWRRGSEGLYPLPDGQSPLGWRLRRLDERGQPSPRGRASLLAGGAHTLSSGFTLTAELLLDEAGYSRAERGWAAEAVRVADVALAAPPGPQTAAAGALLAAALQPGLQVVGRRHLFLQLNRTEWANRADVALRWAWDADHRAGSWQGSLTWFVQPRLELLALVAVYSPRAIEGRVLRHAVLLGVRASL